ncbi:MAG TPA: MBL fold metallo-hydrolase [Solirubrobacterales bacterium]|nr:MBL fold metallo-hydrolase [Solirubrobacterales bacterium]
MRVHHLNCGSFCPHGRRLINGEGGLLERGLIACHCLAIETGDGLVLVDTGFGMEDARNPGQLGAYRHLMNPQVRAETTALAQLEALDFGAGDVRQIVTTHLDLDHSGGLPDFPEAEVHVLAVELEAALHPALREKARYVGAHWRHDPRWVTHGDGGDEWFGFESLRILPGIDAEILLVPLLGHTRGHTGVAVKTGDGWLLHCGDAYFNHGEMATPPSCPPALSFFQNLTASDNAARKANRDRLRELASRHGDEVTLVCGHDPHELEREQDRASVAATAE